MSQQHRIEAHSSNSIVNYLGDSIEPLLACFIIVNKILTLICFYFAWLLLFLLFFMKMLIYSYAHCDKSIKKKISIY